jgi:hypothetical protein
MKREGLIWLVALAWGCALVLLFNARQAHALKASEPRSEIPPAERIESRAKTDVMPVAR